MQFVQCEELLNAIFIIGYLELNFARLLGVYMLTGEHQGDLFFPKKYDRLFSKRKRSLLLIHEGHLTVKITS